MKILTLNTHASRGGAARVAGTVHRYLLNRPEDEAVSAEMIVGWGECDPRHHIFTLYEGRMPKYFRAAWFRLLGTENRLLARTARETLLRRLQEADLVHIHNLHGYYLPLDYLRLLEDKPVVWTLHDFWIATGRCAFPLECTGWQQQCAECREKWRYPGSVRGNLRRNYREKLALVSKMKHLTLTVPSRAFHEELSAYGLNVPDVRIVYNGVDTDVFKPLADGSEQDRILSELNIPRDGRPLLCFVANQVANPRKGLPHLADAMARLKSPARFIVIGSKNGAEQLLADKGGHEVIFTGYLADKTRVARLLQVSDFFINPSVSETFGLTNLESLSCGTRPIVFDIPVFRETLAGWGIFAGGIGGRELAEKITESLQCATTQEMRFAAHRYVSDNFSESPMCRHFMDIYREKIQSVRPGPQGRGRHT